MFHPGEVRGLVSTRVLESHENPLMNPLLHQGDLPSLRREPPLVDPLITSQIRYPRLPVLGFYCHPCLLSTVTVVPLTRLSEPSRSVDGEGSFPSFSPDPSFSRSLLRFSKETFISLKYTNLRSLDTTKTKRDLCFLVCLF